MITIKIAITNNRYGEDTIYAYIAEERRAAYQDASAIYGQWMDVPYIYCKG